MRTEAPFWEFRVINGDWTAGLYSRLAMTLCGLIAVLVALKAASYQPSAEPMFAYQDQFIRLLSFAALTIWITFAMGLRRRGAAAVTALAFAVFVETLLVPTRSSAPSGLIAANLGIVIAYCGLHLYWLDHVKRRLNS